MKKFNFIFIFLLFCIGISQAQNRKPHLYKGMINGKMAVTLFIVSEDNDCTADLRYTAMYKYNKVSKWLQLELTENKKSNNFAMVEYGFTGAMILKKNQSSFNGVWISPDGKKQMKVVFEEVTMNKKEIEDYENRMERVNYENYDC